MVSARPKQANGKFQRFEWVSSSTKYDQRFIMDQLNIYQLACPWHFHISGARVQAPEGRRIQIWRSLSLNLVWFPGVGVWATLQKFWRFWATNITCQLACRQHGTLAEVCISHPGVTQHWMLCGQHCHYDVHTSNGEMRETYSSFSRVRSCCVCALLKDGLLSDSPVRPWIWRDWYSSLLFTWKQHAVRSTAVKKMPLLFLLKILIWPGISIAPVGWRSCNASSSLPSSSVLYAYLSQLLKSPESSSATSSGQLQSCGANKTQARRSPERSGFGTVIIKKALWLWSPPCSLTRDSQWRGLRVDNHYDTNHQWWLPLGSDQGRSSPSVKVSVESQGHVNFGLASLTQSGIFER